MADEFDPYYTWLGIRPEEQPADHYRLIGLRQFEANADVISNAVDQKMQFLRTLQVGKRSALSQKLLNEISGAGGCLLDPERKQAYDKELKAKEAIKQAAAKPKTAPPRPLPRVAAPPAAGLPAALPAASRPLPIAEALRPSSERVAPAPKVEFGKLKTLSRPQASWKLPAILAGGALSVLVLLVVAVYASGLLAPPEKKVVSNPVKNVPSVTPEKNITKPSPEVPSGTKPTPEENPATPTPNVPVPSPGPKNNPPSPVTNAQTWWKDPSHVERLVALQIGTDASAELPDSASRSTLATPLTVELWLRLQLQGDQPAQILGTLLGGEGAVPKGWGLFAKKGAQGDRPKDQLYLEFWKSTGDYIRYPVTLPDAAQWHHLALVFVPEQPSKFFVDGRPIEFPAEKNITSSQRNLVLGSGMQPPGASFQAEVCGLRASESARYGGPFTPPSPLTMTPAEDTFAALDCRLYQPTAATSGKPYPWLFGVGKFDPQSGRIVNFQPLRYGSARQWQGGRTRPDNKLDWIALDPIGGCPGSGPDQLAVRRWIAPADGEVSISGHLRHVHSMRAGDGVLARIVISSTGTSGEWRVFFNDVETAAQGLKVRAGDTIDFAIDSQNNPACDMFEWIVDLKLVDSQQQIVGTWNSARDFRIVPGRADAAPRLREPARSKAQWIQLEDFAKILSVREGGGDPAQLVAQYVPAGGPSNSSPLALKPAPVSNKPKDPFSEPGTIATPTSKKTAVPDAAALAKAKAEVVSVFGDDLKAAKSPSLKQELARKIIDLAKDTREQPTRYALLQEARRLAIEGRDAALATKAVEIMGEQFDVDLLSLKVKLYESLAAESLTPAQRGELLSAACDLGYEALDADQFEPLQAIVGVARSMAVKAATPESKAEAKEFFDAFAKKQKLIDAIKKAEQTLAASPNEPGANLTLGLHYFFTRGDQKKGLALLAKGSDQKLATAAKARERNIAKGVSSSLDEADAWFDAVATVAADYKLNVQKMARDGYTFLAVSSTGLEKAKAEKRRDELTAAVAAAPEAGTAKKLRLKDLPATSPGMVGRVLIDGKDAGVLLTHDPPRDMDRDRMVQILSDAKAPGGQIILEGVLDCPTPMSVKFEHNGRQNGPLQVISVNGKQVSAVGGNFGRFGYPTIQLPAGKHLVQWVCAFDGSNTPNMRILDDGGGFRFLPLYFTREQSYQARKRPTKSEVSLSR